MKTKIILTSVIIIIIASVVINGCKKENHIPFASSPVTHVSTDRLFSVANVYLTEDGKKAEAWFYETPLVFEISIGSPNAKSNFEMLKYAKENNVPVNVRLVANVEKQIDLIIPSTPEQIASFKAEISKRAIPTEVHAPGTSGSLSESKEIVSTLASVVPNMTTLNIIFNKVRAQCCQSPGPYIYGQGIPFQYVADGCYARAHKMRQVIENYYGYTSYKVFNYACTGTTGTLSVKATLWNNNCCQKWWYHVASYVNVQVGTAQYSYVIDPSMFTGPVSISTWVTAQKNTTCYNPSSQGQVYYTSNAYIPSSFNTSTCTLVPYGDNAYTNANNTCATYSTRHGCL